MHPALVKIVIPVYKTDLSKEEWISIDRCFAVLGKSYPVVFVTPESLNIQLFRERYGDTFFVESFSDAYFEGLKGYNRLMLSSLFYERFLEAKYILIYQADVYVFRDELREWCLKGYDYIGAPWMPKQKYLKPANHLFLCAKQWLLNRLSRSNDLMTRKFKVGNGGFSLRNTRLFCDVAKEMSEQAAYYLQRCAEPSYNEDVFWSIEANLHKKRLNIPSYKEAVKFAFEEHPETALCVNKGNLPFGCHAWYKKEQAVFWQQYIY